MSDRTTAEWVDRRFSPREKLSLGLEIVAAYSRARWLLWRTDLPSTVANLRAISAAEHLQVDDAAQAGFRLGQAVGKTLRHLPFDSRCLMRSLVLTRLLAQRGIESTLVIAVQAEPRFHAHAWVESDGIALLEPAGPNFQRLTEV